LAKLVVSVEVSGADNGAVHAAMTKNASIKITINARFIV